MYGAAVATSPQFPFGHAGGRAADKGGENYVSQFRHSPTSHGPETAGVAVAGCRAHDNLCDKRSCLASSSVGHLVDIASVVPATLAMSTDALKARNLKFDRNLLVEGGFDGGDKR